jgi:hypothetical protein
MNHLTAGSVGTNPSRTRSRRRRSGWTWVRLFIIGLVLWVVTVVVTFATQNSNLIPTIILIGSFLVPVTFVMYAFTRALLGWYLVVAVLHSLWDSSRGIAVALTLLLTNTPLQWLTIESGRSPTITSAQVHIFTILTWAFMALVGVLGLFLLWSRWRRAAKFDQRQPITGGLGGSDEGPAGQATSQVRVSANA